MPLNKAYKPPHATHFSLQVGMHVLPSPLLVYNSAEHVSLHFPFGKRLVLASHWRQYDGFTLSTDTQFVESGMHMP